MSAAKSVRQTRRKGTTVARAGKFAGKGFRLAVINDIKELNEVNDFNEVNDVDGDRRSPCGRGALHRRIPLFAWFCRRNAPAAALGLRALSAMVAAELVAPEALGFVHGRIGAS
jgi:hypothetical protein